MADNGNSSHKEVRRNFIVRNLGLIMLAVAIGISLTQVIVANYRLSPPDKSVVRIAFWQLEDGYRDAMKYAIEEYQKLHPNVRIEMMAVTERVYAQWINVHLIAGTAPDLVEIGQSSLMGSDQYKVKYFIPLTEQLEETNPYNAGTQLANVPWRETFTDGNRGGFSDSLQDYYSVPTTFWGLGMYVNMNMLQAAAGLTQPPQTFQQLLNACDKINSLGHRSSDPRYKGKDLQPIVSCYKLGGFEGNLNVAFTSSLEQLVDVNLDGTIGQDETYAGYMNEQFDFYKTPQVRGMFDAYRELVSKYFPRDFASMDRQTAMFKFVQGQACFLVTGSWDGKGLERQIGDKFQIMPMKYPVPAKGEKWGDLCSGPATSATSIAQGGYGIYRFSPNREIALDFLRFLTCVRINGEFNNIANWPPAVAGIEVSDMMKPFLPDPKGFSGALNFRFEEALDRQFSGLFDAYLIGSITYDEFVSKFEKAMNDSVNGGDRAFSLKYKREYQAVRNDDRSLAVQSMLEVLGDDPRDAQNKYRRILLQQVRKNNAQYNVWFFKHVRNRTLQFD